MGDKDHVYLEISNSDENPLEFAAYPEHVSVKLTNELWERIATAYVDHQKRMRKAERYKKTKAYMKYMKKMYGEDWEDVEKPTA